MEILDQTKNATRVVAAAGRYLLAGMLITWGSLVSAEPPESDAPQIRALSAVAGFADTEQYAIAISFAAPKWLEADRLELAFGGIEGNVGTSPFISYGPVWRWQAFSPNGFVELGFSPTLIGDDQFSEDSDLGGHVHFTSSFAVGRTFGEDDETELALRLQHTSNGGLEEINPGLDLLGLSLVVNFPSS